MIGIGIGIPFYRASGGGAPSNTPRTQAFLTATGITDATIISALNAMDNSLISAGLLPSGTGAGKIKALYPFVGGTAATHKFNFVNPADTDAAFRLVFFGGWTHSATGALPNGTNAYADTYFKPFLEITQDNASLGLYSGTSSNNATIAMGCGEGLRYFQIYPNYPSLGMFGDVNDASTTFTSTGNNGSGLIFGNRTNGTEKTHSIRGTRTLKTENSRGNPANFNLILGAGNYQGTISNYSPFQHRLSFMGSGMTNTEMDNFYSLIQSFQTTLGRAV